MKIVWIALVLLAAFLFQQQRAHYRHYLKEETMLSKKLRRSSYLSKAPSPWMLDQIGEDFKDIAQITQESLDATFNQIRHLSPWVVRYRILNNQLHRYFPPNEPITLQDNTTEKALKTLLNTTRFDDMDFIISFFDGVPLPTLPGDFFHASPQAPLLFPAKRKNTPHAILIPDCRSLGHWWLSDIRSVQKNLIPWEEKKDFAIWRGGYTKPLRLTLCKLSHPDYLDAKFPPNEPVDPQYIANRMAIPEFLHYKYLPNVDGAMCAYPALQWRLLSQSLTFKPDSDEIQWFYRALQPHVHYLPVKANLEDLIEKIVWAKANDSLCKSIASNAAQFAKENLLYDSILRYLALVLKKYASIQQLHNPPSGPHWVNIHHRAPLKQLAQSCKMQGFQFRSSPTD